MKSFLAKRGVKEEILSFDARRISNQSREQVERLLQQRSNSFDPNVAKKASAAAAPLAIWYDYQSNLQFPFLFKVWKSRLCLILMESPWKKTGFLMYKNLTYININQ